MNTPESYLDHCATTMQSLSIRELSEQRLGQWLGAGSGFTMYHLGTLATNEGRIQTGLKRSHRNSTEAYNRVLREITTAQVITERVPRVRRLLPAFMGLITIEGHDDTTAMLTEDVSHNKARRVFPCPVHPDVRDRLATDFADVGEFTSVFRSEELDRSVAFDVDGQERWLDLTPSPLNPFGAGKVLYRQMQSVVFRRMDDLTRVVPGDSPLAESLAQK